MIQDCQLNSRHSDSLKLCKFIPDTLPRLPLLKDVCLHPWVEQKYEKLSGVIKKLGLAATRTRNTSIVPLACGSPRPPHHDISILATCVACCSWKRKLFIFFTAVQRTQNSGNNLLLLIPPWVHVYICVCLWRRRGRWAAVIDRASTANS